MMRIGNILTALSLTLLLGWFLIPADVQPDKDFKADDAIETIEVKLDVGDGDDLEEAVALDLGLGFPLWLHPVGRKAEENAPFGAVPQETTAKAKVDAKSRVTFTFAVKAEDGQDALRMTPQLLAGLRVRDIARVGFSSPGTSNWTLAGYEIKINGKVFAAGTPKASRAPTLAQKKLTDLERSMAPLETARLELIDLVKTELASDDDRKELKDIAAKLAPLVTAKRRLEGEAEGRYPWFVDKDFRSAWRDQDAIKSARVTLITATHSGADTQNYVYLHTGGRKFLLGSPALPLTGTAGPQTFTLDLEAGPLTAGDLRVWAVGMLAHPDAFGKAPDRWHPQRLRVEIDGKVAYDSEDNELDRKSLEAIRLIPPVHKDLDGALVVNTPVSRETFVWETGRKRGLDAETGVALPLPDPKDETFPKSETTPAAMEPPDPDSPEAKVEPKDAKDEPKEPDAPMDPDAPAPFPGEKPADPSTEKPADPATPDGASGPGDPSGSSGGGSVSGGDTGGGGGGGSPSGDTNSPPGAQPDPNAPPDPTKVPIPTGPVFQVDNVRIVGGIWKADDTFKVVWKITGDEAAIDKYVVSLQPVQPHLEDPYSAPGIPLGEMPRGSRSASGTLGALPPGVDPRSLFLRPVVTAIPIDPPAKPKTPFDPPATPSAGTGPARAIFPVGSTIVGQPVLQSSFVWWHQPPPPGGIHTAPISWSGPTAAMMKAVWPVNVAVRSDNEVHFDSAMPARNIGVRLEEGDTVRIEMLIPKSAFAGGKRHFIAHLGFLGGPGANNTVKAKMICNWRTAANANVPGTTTVLTPLPAGSFVEAASGDTMKLIDQEFDAAGLPATAHHLRVWIYVTGGPFDLAHPPGLFGVRLVP